MEAEPQEHSRSPQAAWRHEQRPRATDEEFAACVSNPDKAFTIRGDDWIVCLECGVLFRQIDARHLSEYHGAMTPEQYRQGPNPSSPRYGKNTALICNALKVQRSERAKATDLAHRAGDSRALRHLRPHPKGYKQPPEMGRALRARARARNLERDTEIVRRFVIDSQPIKAIAKGLEMDGSPVRAVLRSVFGFGMKDQIAFSRGEACTTDWLNNLCARFGLSKADLAELLRRSDRYAHHLGKLVSREGNRALTTDTADPLVRGEGIFLEALAEGESADRVDYLRTVVPDLATEKWEGARAAIDIARKPDRLKVICNEAQEKNPRARIALAFARSAAAWFPSLNSHQRALDTGELVHHFLATEYRTLPFMLREAKKRPGPAVTTLGIIRDRLFLAQRKRKLGGAPKKPKPDPIKFGEMVQGGLLRFSKGRQIFKFQGSAGLRNQGYSDAEIDCIRDSRTDNGAAMRWAVKNFKNDRGKTIKLKTAKNYLSIFSASKK